LNILVYFDKNCCEKQSRKKTSEYKIFLRKHLKIAKKQHKKNKSNKYLRSKNILKATKEALSQKKWLFAGAKLRYKHLLGNAKAGKPALAAIR